MVLATVAAWTMYDQLHGNADLGVNAILTLSFGLCGVLFWKRFPRRSTGRDRRLRRLPRVGSRVSRWRACSPQYAPKLQVNPELWNVPKFFVAFGMILTLIEDKSRVIEESRERERAANKLLLVLSQISSRLLAGADPAALAGEVTAAVTARQQFRACRAVPGRRRSFACASADSPAIR